MSQRLITLTIPEINKNIPIPSGRPATPARQVSDVEMDDTDEADSDYDDEVIKAERFSDDDIGLAQVRIKLIVECRKAQLTQKHLGGRSKSAVPPRKRNPNLKVMTARPWV